MKILFHRYGSICEPDMIEAFKSLGMDIIEENTEIYEKNLSGEYRIKVLAEQILLKKPAFVFSINYFPYISDVCRKLKVLYVCLSVDCPVLELFSVSIRNSCNRIFLFDYNQYLQFKDENPDCIFYLPLGSNTERWDEILKEVKTSIEKGDKRWLYDVSMVGSLYTEKSPFDTLVLGEFDKGYLDGLMKAQMKFQGLGLLEEVLTQKEVSVLKEACLGKKEGNWSGYSLPDGFCDTDQYVAINYYLGMHISQMERIQFLNMLAKDYKVDLFTRSDAGRLENVQVHGGVSTHKEMPEIFYRSKINLNITIHPIQTGLSQRVWDVLGCGGFLLTNYQMELPDYLKADKEVVCYETPDELKEKVSYYLTHEEERVEIAKAGYEAVKEKHTYRHRAAEILKIVLTMHL